MAIRTPASALSWARAQTTFQTGMCLKFVRTCLGVPAKYATAAYAWSKTRYRHTSTPPAGVPVWWTGGSRGFGHVALSAGGGYVISTDSGAKGRVGRTSISHITRSWGQTYRGWSEDINGVRIYTPPKPPPPAAKPVVDLSQLVAAARSDPKRAQGGQTRGASDDVRIVERALAAEGLLPARYAGDGSFGSLTVKAYAAWQRRCGYTGRDADGIPGLASLRKLGAKRGFTVKA